MKIIDLLNKIANYDEPIIKIKYRDIEFKFDGNTYRDDEGEGMSIIAMIDGDLSNLNDEVEILEEKKIPEKLDYCEEHLFDNNVASYLTMEERRLLDSNFKELGNKINSIIDYLKSKGE